MDDNNDDWKELEEWNNSHKAEEKQIYGVNFQDIKVKKVKWIDRTSKSIKIVGIIFITLTILLGIAFVCSFLYIAYSRIKPQIDIDFEENIEKMYGIKVKVISQNVDPNGNGAYKLQLESNNKIQFTAVKNWGNYSDDYIDVWHKYYFNSWNSEDKKLFTVEENIDNNLLQYKTYIKISNYDELLRGTEAICNFSDFCNQNTFAGWDVFLKFNDKRIYPYMSTSTTKEQAIENAKELFKKFQNN